jgi:hypothetical protein
MLLSGRENGRATMSSPVTHLRLESRDGSPPVEYKIEDGSVAVRRLEPAAAERWQRLTSSDLRNHVERHTVVAEWLRRRLGWRRLLRQCVEED